MTSMADSYLCLPSDPCPCQAPASQVCLQNLGGRMVVEVGDAGMELTGDFSEQLKKMNNVLELEVPQVTTTTMIMKKKTEIEMDKGEDN